MKIEIWKDVKGYEGLYQVSNLGRVKSYDKKVIQKHYWSGEMVIHTYKGRMMALQTQNNGYIIANLTKNKRQRKHLVHRLVATAFLQKEVGKDYINHLDNNPANNRVDNLEWCTQSENIKYAYNNKTKIPPHMKRIYQIDSDGNIVNEFYSMKEAERQTDIKSANISKCCREIRNYAGGYKWKYAE